jgi:AcrR family transcriptional regulator
MKRKSIQNQSWNARSERFVFRGKSMKKKIALKAEADSSRERLLISAEQLFADKGFDGISVRDIANAAGVNSALVGYYFGSKQGLLSEVYTRYCTALNQERARLLQKFSEKKKGPTLEQVLEAFIRPSLEITTDDRGRSNFTRLRVILSAENSALLERLVAANFDPSSLIFVEALSKCLPHLTPEDILWRFHFLLGAIYYTGAGPRRIRKLSAGRCDPSDPAASAEEMIRFVIAGFRAPRSDRSYALPIVKTKLIKRSKTK